MHASNGSHKWPVCNTSTPYTLVHICVSAVRECELEYTQTLKMKPIYEWTSPYMGDLACVRDENLKWKNENNKHTNCVYPDTATHSHTGTHSVPKLTSARKSQMEQREREKEQHHTYVCSVIEWAIQLKFCQSLIHFVSFTVRLCVHTVVLL